MKTKKIFPEIEIKKTDETVELSTRIRKLHSDGKYYLSCMRLWCDLKDCVPENAIQKFFIDCYYCDLSDKFNQPIDTLDESDGSMIFELDENQQPEGVRIEMLLYN